LNGASLETRLAQDRADKLRLSLPLEAADAHDLALVSFEGDIVDLGIERHMLNIQDHVATIVAECFDLLCLFSIRLLPGHMEDDLVKVYLVGVDVCHRPSAAHNGRRITDLEYLAHTVSHIDDRSALRFELAQHVESARPHRGARQL